MAQRRSADAADGRAASAAPARGGRGSRRGRHHRPHDGRLVALLLHVAHDALQRRGRDPHRRQEEYKPLQTNPDLDRLLLLASGLDPDHPAVETLEEIVTTGQAALKRDPFSPKVLNLMAYAYGALGDKQQERAYFNRMNGVLRAINQSGDGLTQKSPRHILMFDHALDLLTAEGLSYDKARVVSRTVEFVPLTVPYVVDGKKRKGFYFDFSRIYWNKPEGYTYKRDRTWQFNNLKPRTYK